MEFFKPHDYADFVLNLDRSWILERAGETLNAKEEYLPDFLNPLCPGEPGDYSSNGDYWWPDPDKPDGLPYIQRDGESNPNAFFHHRRILRDFRTKVSHLTAGFLVSSNKLWATQAVNLMVRFFLDSKTRMNPHLLYAQAIPGITPGRGIGIIDTLHLIEIPVAAEFLERRGVLPKDIADALRVWFASYLEWMITHPQGVDEMNTTNNHSVCWTLQAAVFARFVKSREILDFCRDRFREVIIPGQMAHDGGFPRELGRTKPYGYSLFQLDNMCHLCYVLSDKDHNLWDFSPDGKRSMKLGLDYLYPFMKDKTSWPLPPDVQHWDPWPVRQPSLLFGAVAYGDEKYLDLWSQLERDPKDSEIRRNLAVRQSLLWII
jgi:hypothetical protein